jgi:SAM-dependent methyltransferase
MARFDDDPAFFGELWADDYDQYRRNPDPAPAVDFLAELAGDGRTLELAIGTGRVALPLAARGVPVEGIEGSGKMVQRMRAKPGGAQIPVAIGDMAEVAVEGPFRLVYLVFNTLFNLTDQDRQVACFHNVAQVLERGGAFVIECFVPDPARLDRGRDVQVLEVTEESATIEVFWYDLTAQRYLSQKITFGSEGVRVRPHAMRYAWPAEIDLMARQAGLHLAERYADWDRRPFAPDSTKHISVYRPV